MSLPSLRDLGKGDLIKAEALATVTAARVFNAWTGALLQSTDWVAAAAQALRVEDIHEKSVASLFVERVEDGKSTALPNP
jgi:hypothetical protein